MHVDGSLKYELLSYTYTIRSGGKTKEFKIKSSRGTPELHQVIRQLKTGDKVSISDVLVLYPNQTVKQIKGRTVTVEKSP
jgi:hypothetical protein